MCYTLCKRAIAIVRNAIADASQSALLAIAGVHNVVIRDELRDEALYVSIGST